VTKNKETQKPNIDIEKQTFSSKDFHSSFKINDFFKHCLINGLDELDYLMSHIEDIKQFKQQQLNISNLETQQVLESLIIKSFIYLQEEWMDKSHYILSSSKGRDLAVLLIQTMGNK